LARIILITVSAFYGTNFGCVKILGDALDPSFAAFMRFGIASLLFSPYVVEVLPRNPKLIRGGLEVGAYNAFGYWAQSISLQTSHASTAAFICSLAVIVVPILDSLFDSQKSLDSLKKSIFPALLAATGVASLELGGAELPGVGDLWAFLQPLFFGLAFWRVERHMKNCTQPGEAQAFTGTMMMMVAFCSFLWTSHDFVAPMLQAGGLPQLTTAIAHQLNELKDWHILAALVLISKYQSLYLFTSHTYIFIGLDGYSHHGINGLRRKHRYAKFECLGIHGDLLHRTHMGSCFCISHSGRDSGVEYLCRSIIDTERLCVEQSRVQDSWIGLPHYSGSD